MDTQYFFPSKEEIDRNLEQQNGNKISFKSRGMSDNSLKYLLEVLKDDNNWK